jgi:hypothetical protein
MEVYLGSFNAMRMESSCALTKVLEYIFERTIVVKTELNNYTLHRNCTSIAV